MLPDTCNLLTATETSDGMGGIVQVWGTASAGVKCRIDHLSGREAVWAASIQPFHGFVLSLPHATTITEAYRVEVGTVTYNVRSVDNGKSWSAVVRALVDV